MVKINEYKAILGNDAPRYRKYPVKGAPSTHENPKERSKEDRRILYDHLRNCLTWSTQYLLILQSEMEKRHLL
jgi:hypothetical protein